MKEYVIVVAGGTGSRMGSNIPKQFLLINGLPVLMHTIKAFRDYSEKLSIIIVLPADQFDFWQIMKTMVLSLRRQAFRREVF